VAPSQTVQRIKENDPHTTVIKWSGMERNDYFIQSMTNKEWEELGRDIANNTHLKDLTLNESALNLRAPSFLFRGLTRSSSIKQMNLNNNRLSATGVRSMVPFLQNANNLTSLDLDNNNIQSEGFNELFRALRDSPIEMLHCDRCGIGSIEIDRDHIPKHLTFLRLNDNSINTDGCRGIAKLLQGDDSTLSNLYLYGNKIDDNGVGILVDALQNSNSLTTLNLSENYGISKQGMTMLLKFVNDISSIKATLESNHTLDLYCKKISFNADKEIQRHIGEAMTISRNNISNPEAAGREKVIQTQLNSVKRAELADLQGVNQSLYNEIDPLHLPEVLSLVGHHHGHGELYVALKSSIVGLFSTVNMKKCMQKKKEYHVAKAAEHAAIAAEHRAKAEEIDAKLATMDQAAEANQVDVDSQSNKRRRT